MTIVPSGDVMTIYPKRPSLQEMAARLRALPGPGKVQAREDDLVAERPKGHGPPRC